MTTTPDYFILATVIDKLPPPLQKKALYQILETCNVKITKTELEEMEKMYGLQIKFDMRGWYNWLTALMKTWDKKGPEYVLQAIVNERNNAEKELEKLQP